MGGDGGSIPGRQDLVKQKKQKKSLVKETRGESTLHSWTHCKISNELLKIPICIDNYGNLYNKEFLLEKMLDKSLPKSLNYIKKLSDIININTISIIKNDKKEAIFECPITSIIGNGVYPFICIRKCGCILSLKAFNEIKSKTCLVCGKKLDKNINDYSIIPINATQKQKDNIRELIKIRKNKKLNKIKKKINDNNNIETKEDDTDLQQKNDEIIKKVQKYETLIKRNKQKQSILGKRKRIDNEDVNRIIEEKKKKSKVFKQIFKNREREFNFAGGKHGL